MAATAGGFGPISGRASSGARSSPLAPRIELAQTLVAGVPCETKHSGGFGALAVNVWSVHGRVL